MMQCFRKVVVLLGLVCFSSIASVSACEPSSSAASLRVDILIKQGGEVVSSEDWLNESGCPLVGFNEVVEEGLAPIFSSRYRIVPVAESDGRIFASIKYDYVDSAAHLDKHGAVQFTVMPGEYREVWRDDTADISMQVRFVKAE